MPKPTILPSSEYLNECLDYCPETGTLTWKRRPREHFRNDLGHRHFLVRFAGKVAGGVDFKGYIKVIIDGASYMAHRVIWTMTHGEWPAQQIDHVDLNKANNRLDNLIEVDNGRNCMRRNLMASNTSTVTGVGYHKGNKQWIARLMVAGKSIWLGGFDKFEDAVAERMAANVRYGFPSNHGMKKESYVPETKPGLVSNSNTSGVVGVHWNSRSRKWISGLSLNGKRLFLGAFDAFEDAVKARREAEQKYRPVNKKGRVRVSAPPNQ